MGVLVPIDDSEPAKKAVEHAAREFPETDLTLIHVINPGTGMYGEGGAYAYDSIIKSRREDAAELLEEAAEIAAEYGHSVMTETVVGQPANEIVSFATESDIDHIVLGSHGRSGPSRVLLGSVAELVARRAPVPVTIVR
ncbi:universal stress protein [Natronolimnobius sp. AArcel1]|uniref:universal stress protein n=1 Tax=Natronolimnobius sp. AArcel1 TaxID=1679093 RepID=UPI0013EB2CCE|nr:universal stress protein [Natronolimnobius sp. AArcel1]NGM70591.1 universal stress protein [Natronolimnobius sp. AArcel1]